MTRAAAPLGSDTGVGDDGGKPRAPGSFGRISMRRLFTPLVALATAVVMLFASDQAMAQTEVTLWTHWAAEKIKRDFVEDAIRRFEEKNPGVKIKASWYEKTALYAALKTALRAGQAPDIFYAEPDQVEYMDNGFLLDLSDLTGRTSSPGPRTRGATRASPTASRSRPRRSSSTTTRRWSTSSA